MKKSDIIMDALKHRRRNETLEKAIGKAVRRSGGSFEYYIEIMSCIREKRRAKKLTLLDAARKVADGD
ncbi:MAG: hypothetical protein ACE5IJ_00080 [Thermoplasmata archaeon]